MNCSAGYNSRGIYLENSNNVSISTSVLFANGYGLHAAESENCSIAWNTVSNNTFAGIILVDAQWCMAIRNDVSDNNYGIIAYSGSTNCTINNNSLSDNVLEGLVLMDVNYFKVNWNNFLGNNLGSPQGLDDGTGNIFMCNYWDDWTGPDANTDGFVDVPYSISGTASNEDQYPLAIPVDFLT